MMHVNQGLVPNPIGSSDAYIQGQVFSPRSVPMQAISNHASVTTGVHGLAITLGQTLTVTTGGTLGSAAYTAATDYDTAGSAAAAEAASQPVDTQLTAIAALADAAGYLNNNGAGVFSYSTPATGTGSYYFAAVHG